MFTWNKQPESQKDDIPQIVKVDSQSHQLTLDDLDHYSDNISALCLKKCLNDPEEPALNTAQRVCLHRCAYKMASSIHYMNKLCGYYELKVDRFQEVQASMQAATNHT